MAGGTILSAANFCHLAHKIVRGFGNSVPAVLGESGRSVGVDNICLASAGPLREHLDLETCPSAVSGAASAPPAARGA